MNKIHLDTDLGGDIDDLCALAMLLRWARGVHLTGITIVGDSNGRRTGYVRYVLGLEKRSDIPVAAGADTSQGFYRYELGLPLEERYWPEPIVPSPNAPEEAIHLLKKSIEQGATIIGIGPYTNLYLLDIRYPGILMQARLFLMGGYVYPPRPGYPNWGNEMDFNVQVDVRSAKHVIQNSKPTLIPLAVTVETSLRRACLDDLRMSGALGHLIAQQAEAFAADEKIEMRYGETCEGLPRDIINFQHDPLACAIALGWDEGTEIKEIPLLLKEKDGWLTERIHPSGKPIRIVTKVDGSRFSEFWINTIVNR
ncbi:MAG: nucleoside hydrolase [Anaerolineae bacterium]|nr:nucleoside hydrolase [Anaerolineae bacterium]